MSQLKVNAIRHTGASSDAVTLATDGTCTAKITNNLSNRNLIIGGAMNIAQRGTSSTSGGFQTVDRFQNVRGGMDEAITQAQHALTSSDTGPWEKGFRYSYHLTNGNQTSGAGASDYSIIRYNIEAQDMASCGWDYTSASSYITLSFWVKSSVAQNFYGNLLTGDGTMQNYPYETGSLSANTWTKITKKIPGNANLQFDNDNGAGFQIDLWAFGGTTYTASPTLNTWAAYASGTRMPANTSTWWTTNDATFEITGVQLEVGDVATDFEHRSYGAELARCQRYFYMLAVPSHSSSPSSNYYNPVCTAYYDETDHAFGVVHFPVTMRTAPDLYKVVGTNYFDLRINSGSDGFDDLGLNRSDRTAAIIYSNGNASGTAGHGTMIRLRSESAARIGFEAEL